LCGSTFKAFLLLHLLPWRIEEIQGSCVRHGVVVFFLGLPAEETSLSKAVYCVRRPLNPPSASSWSRGSFVYFVYWLSQVLLLFLLCLASISLPSFGCI